MLARKSDEQDSSFTAIHASLLGVGSDFGRYSIADGVPLANEAEMNADERGLRRIRCSNRIVNHLEQPPKVDIGDRAPQVYCLAYD